jgi:hypothetical protein
MNQSGFHICETRVGQVSYVTSRLFFTSLADRILTNRYYLIEDKKLSCLVPTICLKCRGLNTPLRAKCRCKLTAEIFFKICLKI